MRSKQLRKQKDGSLKKEGMDLGGGLPDPDLPLSQQLEQSFDTIKSHSQSIKVNNYILHRNSGLDNVCCVSLSCYSVDMHVLLQSIN